MPHKKTGDSFSSVSPFGYEFTGTIIDVLRDTGTDEGNIYTVQLDAKKGEFVGIPQEVDTNFYLPQSKPTDEAQLVAVITP